MLREAAHSREDVICRYAAEENYVARATRRRREFRKRNSLLYPPNLRTGYALREVMSMPHSLNDVALNNGFPNSRVFANVFSKRCGRLPSMYRRRTEKRGRKDKKVLL